MTDSLLTEWGEHDVLTLTLNRPERRNALDPELLIALAESLDSHGDRSRAVILRGAGVDAFSAGYDLSRLTGTPADLEADRFIGEAVNALRQCPAPVIARLQGHCYGAGVELALNCDLRIASPTLRMSVPAVSLGVVYRYQFVARLVQICGIARAADLLLAMPELDAESAMQWGLVTEVTDDVEGRVAEVARRRAAAPPDRLHRAKANRDPLEPRGL